MCPHTDTNEHSLQVHVNKTHLDITEHNETSHSSCPLCPATLPSADLLQEHVDSVHSDPPPPRRHSDESRLPVCPVCGETGWSAGQLQVHVESHFNNSSGGGD